LAEIAYSSAEVNALVNEDVRDLGPSIESDLVTAAVELREYLRAAIVRPRASQAKVSLGIAVLDIWRLFIDKESSDGENDGLFAASVVTLGIATSLPASASDGSGDIVRACRSRIEASIQPGDQWDQIWKRSEDFGGTIGFRIDVEAARADRLWESLLAFAAPDVPVALGFAPSESLNALIAVESRIKATSSGDLSSTNDGLTSSHPTHIVYDAIVGASAPIPEWKELESSEPDNGAKRIRIWFGTNREPTSRNDKRCTYSNRLAPGELSYGVCQVNIPRVGELSGGSLPFVSAWMRIGNRSGRPRVESYFRFDGPDEFVSALDDEMAHAQSERNGLVFIHGYATNFTDAATAAARFSINVKHRGPTAMFTWASKGRKFAYRHDEGVVEQSRRQLIDFLATMSERAGLEHVDIVVHSLGNRLLLRSLIDWFSSSPPTSIPLRNIYLGAPDIDQPEFVRDADVYARAGVKTTLYSSDSDAALLASLVVHRLVPRVGLMPPVVTTTDIDTIETSGVDFSRVRHAYVLDSSSIRGDISSVQSGMLDPSARANVHSAGSGLTPDYWRIV
jgi:esterase/lipase superfamily enzyme